MKVTCNAESMNVAVKSKLFGLTTDDAAKVTPLPDKDTSNADGLDFHRSCNLGDCGMTYKIADEKLVQS